MNLPREAPRQKRVLCREFEISSVAEISLAKLNRLDYYDKGNQIIPTNYIKDYGDK